MLVGLFVFGVAFLYLRAYFELVKVNYQISVVEKEIAVWEARCDDLRKQIEFLSSDEYVEKVAREELGLVKPGEVPFIVAEPGNPDAFPGVAKRAGADPKSIRD
ncbi:MAG: septum formation initiator family protein [Firmicutes bacterium]|nr:septum formation initiator family protein [Bacillota bacterium]MDH7496340.1 septum formation initiator family protein [Bacillota bacterium]